MFFNKLYRMLFIQTVIALFVYMYTHLGTFEVIFAGTSLRKIVK